MTENPATIGPFRCGRGQPLLVIAGPCVMETEELTLSIAACLKQICRRAFPAAGLQGLVRQGQPHERRLVSRSRAGRKVWPFSPA